MNPKISIITPTRHRPDLLARCIIAIQQQEIEEYEHIIISDDCPYAEKVYNEFKEDKRIRLFKGSDYKERIPCSCLRNFSILKSNSDYICYCDDDNVLLPNHCKVIYEVLKRNEYDVVFSKFYHVGIGTGNGQIIKILKKSLFDYSGYDSIRNSDTICIGHTKKALEKAGYWRNFIINGRERPGDDDELFDRMKKTKLNIKYIPDITGIYYSRSAHNYKDNEYYKKVIELKNEIYAYPELIEKVKNYV